MPVCRERALEWLVRVRGVLSLFVACKNKKRRSAFFEFYSPVADKSTIPQIAGYFALCGRVAACFARGDIFYDAGIDGA